MKLLFVNRHQITAYHFNQTDANEIIALCNNAGKLWGNALVGFLISENVHGIDCAVNIKTNDGTIESMEYLDLETGQPEFQINHTFIAQLNAKTKGEKITLSEFSPVLEAMLNAPFKARRWEVYPVVNDHYQVIH